MSHQSPTPTAEAVHAKTGESGGPAHWQIISHHPNPEQRKTWSAQLIQRDGPLHIFQATFTQDVNHAVLGYIPRGTASLEYFWADRWYNIFRFATPGGQLRNYYCNIALPPVLTDATLTYHDLDLDLYVSPEGRWQILDKDEFATTAQLYAYSDHWRTQAQNALRELIALVAQRQFPFAELGTPLTKPSEDFAA